MSYADAYARQVAELEGVLADREGGRPRVGTLLLVEHDPVVTVSRRPGAASHLVATPAMLERAGVAVEATDRGGDVTYHGPGQLVAYPILDLNLLGLGLHDYMRLLEESVIRTLAAFGIAGERDPTATGVWVGVEGGTAKVAAMGVRVRRWASMHGLSINVSPRMEHFDLIVPCGLAGRAVTSMERLLGAGCPEMGAVKRELVAHLEMLTAEAAREARHRRS